MPDSIDYDFISAREGGRLTKGYVPAAGVSKSGVTIATGFDLGARNEGDLSRLGLSKELTAKLKPYLGKVRVDAENLLKKTPLVITAEEAEVIDKAVKKAQVETLKTRYTAAPDNKDKKDFFDLPVEAQTVIASVSFQYGDLSKKAPSFWKAATTQDWAEVSKVLKNFGDVYKTRRKLEAELIDKIVPTTTQAKP